MSAVICSRRRPALERTPHKIRIEGAEIAGDFTPCPVRRLDFGENQALIFAVKRVDFPNFVPDFLPASRFFD
jgi:hypothetical protein